MSFSPSYVLTFDVESVGLHGQGFAVGWVVHSLPDGVEIESGMLNCIPENARSTGEDDSKWVREHCAFAGSWNCLSPLEVRTRFWAKWQDWKTRGAVLAADCHWPVEARFLNECVDDDLLNRKWAGPYPFLEIGSILYAAGMNPTGTFERQPEELPLHNPLCDARQSARLLLQALKTLREARAS